MLVILHIFVLFLDVQIGERIKLLRMLAGLTQVELAKFLDLSQHNVAMMESGRYKPRIVQINTLVELFGCLSNWLSNGTLPAFSKLGYAVLPSKAEVLGSTRRINEIDDTIRTLFISFLQENNVKDFYMLKAEQERVYIFCLANNAVFFLIARHARFVDPIEYAISECKLFMNREIQINIELFRSLISSDIAESSKALMTILRDVGLKKSAYYEAYLSLKERSLQRDRTVQSLRSGENRDLMKEIMITLEKYLEKEKIQLTTEKKAAIIVDIYSEVLYDAKSKESVDDRVKRFVKFAS